jgi:transposase
MTKSRAYSAVDVQRVSVESWLAGREGGSVWIGIDVGKDECMMVLRWPDGRFERPVRWENPGQIPLAVGCLCRVVQGGLSLTVAMESSGTYGDALRQALADAGLAVQRVAGKATKDYAEVFDGVPSQHDGKDAAILAELGAIGKSVPWAWQAPSADQQQLSLHVELLDIYQRQWVVWVNRIEAWVARHWPEVGKLLDLGSVTLLELLVAYGGPAAVAADPSAAARLAGWGRRWLKPSKIAEVIASAHATLGVRATEVDCQRVRHYAAEALRALREVQEHRRGLAQHSHDCPDVQRLAPALGLATACVLRVAAGDPATYQCGRAYQKALGLNLTERSSGRYKGRLKISKRGSGLARRWMYLAALRLVRQDGVSRWYARKVARDGGNHRPALVAVMRKMALGIYRCAVDGVNFDPRRLFANTRATEPAVSRR